MMQIYKKDEFIVITVCNEFIVINTHKPFKEAHTHVKSIKLGRLLIDLAIKEKLPKNYRLTDSLIRITDSYSYAKKLKEFKADSTMSIKEIMEEKSDVDSERCIGR
ncbi:hypothetical protein [Rhodopseudomonas parapalustris]